MGIHTDYPAPAPLWNFNHERAFLLFLLLLVVPPVTAQLQNTPPPPSDPFARLKFDKTMAVVLVMLFVVFFALGFVSIYTRQCAERRIVGRIEIPVVLTGGADRRQPRGLDPAIIETFPVFVYSEVKGLKIGRATLECAVCLNEFRDDETLRLIPKCSHVFHRDCIDAWLLNHSTCPVCRANLVPKLEDAVSSVTVQIPDPGGSEPNRAEPEPSHDANCITINPVNEPPSLNLDGTNRPVRSRSTGFGIGRLFPRSHSTGHSLVRPGEDCERFTLRLPEEVRDRLVSSVSQTVTWQQESSGRSGYRTRSVGRRYLHYERFSGESRLDRLDRRGFMWTPPFLGRAGSLRSNNEANKGVGGIDESDVGERSSDCLLISKV